MSLWINYSDGSLFPARFSPSATFNGICDDAHWRLIQMYDGCVCVHSYLDSVCLCVVGRLTSSHESRCVVWWGNKASTGEFISSPERAVNKQLVNQCLHLFFLSDNSACVSSGAVAVLCKAERLPAAIFPPSESEKTCHTGLVFHYRESVYDRVFSSLIAFTAIMEHLYEWCIIPAYFLRTMLKL